MAHCRHQPAPRAWAVLAIELRNKAKEKVEEGEGEGEGGYTCERVVGRSSLVSGDH